MRQFSSLFSQILKLIDRNDFAAAMRETKVNRVERSFSSWDQLVALLFCQLGRAHSLREICDGMRTCEGKLSHLGVRSAPSRSTLSHANARRNHELMKLLFLKTYARLSSQWQRDCPGQRGFRFKNKLLSLDATTINVCLEQFDWAKFRRTKGAIKMHLLLDHDGYMPAFASLTTGATHEITVARTLQFAPGTIVVFDRGYNDYTWFKQLTRDKVFFVTREKEGAAYEFVKEDRMLYRRAVACDDDIEVRGSLREPLRLRRIVIQDPESGEYLTFWTNHFKLSATTIGAIYKDRWQIELFFKSVKGLLKIKTFLGTTPNAVWTQVWTALLTLLILRYMQLRARYAWSLSNLLALVRMNLFTYRDLWGWLHDPFQTPPHPPDWQQTLSFT